MGAPREWLVGLVAVVFGPGAGTDLAAVHRLSGCPALLYARPFFARDVGRRLGRPPELHSPEPLYLVRHGHGPGHAHLLSHVRPDGGRPVAGPGAGPAAGPTLCQAAAPLA